MYDCGHVFACLVGDEVFGQRAVVDFGVQGKRVFLLGVEGKIETFLRKTRATLLMCLGQMALTFTLVALISIVVFFAGQATLQSTGEEPLEESRDC